MNLLKHRNCNLRIIITSIVNIGDSIDYGQKNNTNIGDLI